MVLETWNWQLLVLKDDPHLQRRQTKGGGGLLECGSRLRWILIDCAIDKREVEFNTLDCNKSKFLDTNQSYKLKRW